MVDNFTHAKPKPMRDNTPDAHEITFKGRFGSDGALFAFINHVREIGNVSQGRYSKRADGSIEQTITVSVYELARSYETRPEKPFVDKSGDVYLFRSRKTPGRYKLGESTRTLKRVGEVNRAFEEDFERIHIIHSDDAYALEQALHKKYSTVREEGQREIFWFTDQQVDEIRAL